MAVGARTGAKATVGGPLPVTASGLGPMARRPAQCRARGCVGGGAGAQIPSQPVPSVDEQATDDCEEKAKKQFSQGLETGFRFILSNDSPFWKIHKVPKRKTKQKTFQLGFHQPQTIILNQAAFCDTMPGKERPEATWDGPPPTPPPRRPHSNSVTRTLQ